MKSVTDSVLVFLCCCELPGPMPITSEAHSPQKAIRFGVAAAEKRKLECEQRGRDFRTAIQRECDELNEESTEIRQKIEALRHAVAVARRARDAAAKEVEQQQQAAQAADARRQRQQDDARREIDVEESPRREVSRLPEKDPQDAESLRQLRSAVHTAELKVALLRKSHLQSFSDLQTVTKALSQVVTQREQLRQELAALQASEHRAALTSASEHVVEAQQITAVVAQLDATVEQQSQQIQEVVSERKSMLSHLLEGWRERGQLLARSRTELRQRFEQPDDRSGGTSHGAGSELQALIYQAVDVREQAAMAVENASSEWEALHSYAAVLKARVLESTSRFERRRVELAAAKAARGLPV